MWELYIGTILLRLVSPDVMCELSVPDKERLHIYHLKVFYKNFGCHVEIDSLEVERYRVSACVRFAEHKAASVLEALHAADLEATPAQGSA